MIYFELKLEVIFIISSPKTNNCVFFGTFRPTDVIRPTDNVTEYSIRRKSFTFESVICLNVINIQMFMISRLMKR